MKLNIAIDGPSAAGKSTIAKRLAALLGYVHLDTGAMYRCIAYKALCRHLSLTDEAALCALIDQTEIELTPQGEVFLDGEKMDQRIRTDEVSMATSRISALKGVREKLVARQKKMAENKGVIMDGRDIGTVVLPQAELKIFLTASAEARACRRYRENEEKGMASDYEQLVKDIAQRDAQDMQRTVSPLRQAADAVLVDSSNLSSDEVVDLIRAMAEKKQKEAKS